MKLIQRHPLPSCRLYDGSYIEHETTLYPRKFSLQVATPNGFDIAYGELKLLRNIVPSR